MYQGIGHMVGVTPSLDIPNLQDIPNPPLDVPTPPLWTYPPLSEHSQPPPLDRHTLLLVTSGGHQWRPIQTCSLESLPSGTEIYWRTPKRAVLIFLECFLVAI